MEIRMDISIMKEAIMFTIDSKAIGHEGDRARDEEGE